MKNNYTVQSMSMRYVVPFRVGSIYDFKDVFDIVEKSTILDKNRNPVPKWIRQKESSSESDIYEYVRNEFRFNNKDEKDYIEDNDVGASWLHRDSLLNIDNSGKGVLGADSLFYGDYLNKTGWKISVNNLGLLLFKNGIGIIWYDLVLPDNISSNDLIAFQNDIKELNRADTLTLWRTTKKEPSFGYVCERKTIKDNRQIITYRTPFSIAEWINEQIIDLKPAYFASRVSAYQSKLKRAFKVLSNNGFEIIGSPEIKADKNIVPDKCLLFSYVSFADSLSSDELLEMAFYLSKGYTDAYKMNSEASKEGYAPFENIQWYAAKEGSAIITMGDSEMMKTGLLGKVQLDYFDLFLRVIFQSYSLLRYAERIQSDLSGEVSKYLVNPIDSEITKLYGEINLFLAKSMATSVSYIHHQNEFYVYLKERFRLHEDVESVSSGLEALDSLQREEREAEDDRIQKEQEEKEKKRDNKLQAIMGLFALLGISSALTDCFDFISKFSGPESEFSQLSPATHTAAIVCLILVGIISIVALCAAVVALYNALIDKNDSTDKGI